jgi:hypothetical protein
MAKVGYEWLMSSDEATGGPSRFRAVVRALVLSHTRYGQSEAQLVKDVGKYGMSKFAWSLVAFVVAAGTLGGLVVWRSSHSGLALLAILMCTYLFAIMIAYMALLARKTPTTGSDHQSPSQH